MYEENESGDMSSPWQTSLHKIYIVSTDPIINTTSLMPCS